MNHQNNEITSLARELRASEIIQPMAEHIFNKFRPFVDIEDARVRSMALDAVEDALETMLASAEVKASLHLVDRVLTRHKVQANPPPERKKQ